jgi:hypothetical protein
MPLSRAREDFSEGVVAVRDVGRAHDLVPIGVPIRMAVVSEGREA